MKEAREARKAKYVANLQKNNKQILSPVTVGVGLIVLGSGFLIYDLNTNRSGFLGSMYYGSDIHKYLSSFMGQINEIFEPSSDKLLPDWPTAPCYAGVAPGTPCPPLLILDLEKTLIGSTYDSRYGWRHVKRPGLDKFLKALSQYYEIVIFSENDIGIVQEVLMAIDPEGVCHKLGASAAEQRGTVMLKRLDYMNRDLARVILIDDNPESFQLFPRNTIEVRPFNNIEDTTDSVLLDLIPLLQAFVHDGVQDFRRTLDDLGTHEAEEAVLEYRMRLSEKKRLEQQRRSKGLGSLLRGATEQSDDGYVRSTILSASQIVGAAPGGADEVKPISKHVVSADLVEKGVKGLHGSGKPKKEAVKREGGLKRWFDDSQKEKMEQEKIKIEKMNEIYMQRLASKSK